LLIDAAARLQRTLDSSFAAILNSDTSREGWLSPAIDDQIGTDTEPSPLPNDTQPSPGVQLSLYGVFREISVVRPLNHQRAQWHRWLA
jgi:hypothetical protein